jgi:polyisoprenoid-binding protein YceI
MNGIRSAVAASALGIGVVLAGRAFAGDSYTIDHDHSIAIFRITHVNTSASWGRFDDVSGKFVEDADPSKSTVEVTVKTDSVDTNQKKRDEHLKSPDFLNAKQFPAMTFKSKSVKKVDDKTFEVSGDFTLHGVTKPLTVKLARIGSGKSPFGDFRAGYETTFTIKRSDFDMKNMLDAVGDEVQVTLSVEGVREDTKK